MFGDMSRIPRPAIGKSYRQVVLQQGRVLLDGDFNEQGAMQAFVLRQLTADLLGAHAGPAQELGFAIEPFKTALGRIEDFSIAYGRYYVHGLLVDHDRPSAGAHVVTFTQQEGGAAPDGEDHFRVDVPYFFFLDAWERSVTWLEDEGLREVALGGPDTAVRRQVVWRVRALEVPLPEAELTKGDNADKWLEEHVVRHPPVWPGAVPRLPIMRAWVNPDDNPDETPCVADPLGGYRGLENQLYRVQIHTDGADGRPVTFKWSRENGSVIAAWTGMVGETLLVEGVHDTAHGFAAGQWVEICDRIGELRGEPGTMVRLSKVEPGRLTFDHQSGPVPRIEDLSAPIVRRWDHRQVEGIRLEGGAVVLEEGKSYKLERGINVRFPKKPENVLGDRRYAVSDWWGFAARVATGDIDWPHTTQLVGGQEQKTYLDRTPDGPEHVYAPLAVGTLNGAASSATSLQRKIVPPTDAA